MAKEQHCACPQGDPNCQWDSTPPPLPTLPASRLTRSGLLAVGGNAPLGDDLLRTFALGDMTTYARRELPDVCKALGITTVGDLAGRTRSEIQGRGACTAGNKSADWLEYVCGEFGIELMK